MLSLMESGLSVFLNKQKKANTLNLILHSTISLPHLILSIQPPPIQFPPPPLFSIHGDRQLRNGNHSPSLGINTGSDSPDNSQ